nr:protein sel-1 homolog 2 [Mirounga angustirostris]
MGIKILQQSKSQKQKAEAYVFFAKAADMGNLKAMEKMADALLFGNFGMQNITAAIQLYESLAKEGSYKAQNALGFLSSYGIGMEYNQAKALIYYTFGSAGGSMMSQMILGYRYLSGINVLQNCEVALNHYKKVADYIADKLEKSEGIPVEKVRLTERPENLSSNSEILDWDIYQYYKFLAERGDVQIQKALYYFLKAAKAGSANAMAFIGKALHWSNMGKILDGRSPIALNYIPQTILHRALPPFPSNAFARVKIGDYHYYGYGTKKDYQTAATHYSIAADKYHSAQAMFNLAYMYEHGLGIAKDIHLARRFYDMAAQTSPDAHVPVFFALVKLETVHLLQDILFFNQFTMKWKWMKLDNTLVPYWDLFVIGLIVAVLIFLLRNRYG